VIDKRASLSEATRLVSDENIIGLGGMTLYRRPVSFVKTLIGLPQPPRNLTLLALTASLAGDLLVGSGLAKSVRTCYFGFEIFGLAPMFTTAAHRGDIRIIEESEASLANGIRAQLAGVSYLPAQAWQGTDMFVIRPDVKQIIDPYTGQELTAFPAISCDISIIHVLKADYLGNCILGGNPTIDLELASISDRVVVTAEEVVEQIHGDVDIIGNEIDIVVEVPRGAWPTSCYPLYPIDGLEILRYMEYCNNGRFDKYLDESAG
jgi:glutaconate CoA-transferase subunit A